MIVFAIEKNTPTSFPFDRFIKNEQKNLKKTYFHTIREPNLESTSEIGIFSFHSLKFEIMNSFQIISNLICNSKSREQFGLT